ncbi:MAG: GNAT family N-acetyltransferase [Bacteroidales bacterium]|nr:GNAT family N-acetyltransferase [Bacteroidales bacterium]
MEIVSLKNMSFGYITDTFLEAFADYDIDIDKEQLRAMLSRRGFRPELSFGAVEDERMVAFTFNGIGNFNGISTAYDTGTGTLPCYRGRGLASQIFNEAEGLLKDAGISQYLLEVLQHNIPAIKIYRSHGFEVTREFNCYTTSDPGEKCLNHPVLPELTIEEVGINDIVALGLDRFEDFSPSWQNDNNSIKRASESLRGVVANVGDDICGYGITEPASGDITRIAVSPVWRRKGIGSSILNTLSQFNCYGSLKVVNVQIDCLSVNAFLKACGFELKCRQFEMVKRL